MDFIPFAKPEITDDEINEVVDTMKSGWMTSGPKTARFEEQFKEKLGSPYALALSSATAGLHLALSAIELQADEFVITSPYTFNSTVSVIHFFKAHPLLVDVDPETCNICPEKIEQAIQDHPTPEKIKAITVVHVAGQACEMDKIMAIAKKYDLRVIEDCAHALPSTFKGQNVGTIGDFGVFSFYATKTLCTGEGGMIIFKDEKYLKKLRSRRLHGFTKIAWDRYSGSTKRNWEYTIDELGYKYNMTDIAASMGLHQLRKAELFHEKRDKIAKIYDEHFHGLPQVKTPIRKEPNDLHAFHLYIIQVDKNVRDAFIEKLQEKNVGTSVHFIPVHLFDYWKGHYNYAPEDFPNALSCFESAISLPIYTILTDEQIQHIVKSVKEVAQEL